MSSELFPKTEKVSINTAKEHQQKEQTTFQQCFLLYILNKHAKITIKRPKKYSSRTSTIPILSFLETQASRVDVLNFAIKRCEAIKNEEMVKGIPLQTIKRRFNKNMSAFIRNFVFDSCLEFGYFFNSKLSKNSMKSIQSEKIRSVFYDGKFVTDKKGILELGKVIHQKLMSVLKDRRVVTFEIGELVAGLANDTTQCKNTITFIE
ncbi:hypothetical protein EIN_452800 [Entamoeba invadens IP1]|uniref:Uncharacterized protein n=1 Tax=Entamoeba invadens IP1 TaxID=370355 RepID=L7FLV8_ENTIV|nr:hypothetical protein EIN_452800 [Entamoeba invadens IP1]ELP89680.1 hypothetical protein EIN_452800 [Entamoeba invadens IP1]|eukprot:XP_004256451.1 hypothetical protein EIN_452800 [Entamoeba invadens IP1]